MFVWICALVIAAGLAAGLFLHSRTRHRRPRTKKYLVIIAADSQSTIEWWVRTYMFWNWLRGVNCEVVCIDLGSQDDTRAILVRLKRRFRWLEIIEYAIEERGESAEQLIPHGLLVKQPVVLDLRQPTDLRLKSVLQHL